jgi:ATP-dependent Clp protease ATP-binding subunit ClpB
MNLGNFTIKAAELIQQAQQLAFNSQNPNIESEHLLKAMLDQQDSPVEYLLKKNNVTINLLESRLDEMVGKLPKTSSEPAQSISRDLNNVVLRAGSVLKSFGDEFVTPEHLLLAMIQGERWRSETVEGGGTNRKRIGHGHQGFA